MAFVYHIVSAKFTSERNVLNQLDQLDQLDRFSNTYCTSKQLHFVSTHDALENRLIDNKKRLIVRCVDSQDRVIEFQPEAPKIL